MTRCHRLLLVLLGLLFFLSSCAPRVPLTAPAAVAPTTVTPATSVTAVPHAAEIRFALIGTVGNPGVWALFDSSGYSYNNYAVRSAYWPRLYDLIIPDGSFEPQAAAGMPSPIQQEGAFFTATVPLRADLKWTDGAPFTAGDVAFTVNTSVAFQLGFDWHAYYDPAYLDHAEALDAQTVKFFFKKAPNVAVWQYGTLLGPVVQKAYWAPKLVAAASMLPTSNQLVQTELLETQVADQQKSIKDLILRGATASGESVRQLQIELQNQQRRLDGLNNALTKAHDAVDGNMDSARRALYAVDASGEPTLGTWISAGESNGTWTNAANPAQPFASPNFDRAVYVTYPDEASAVAALKNGKVNAVLEPEGISAGLAAQTMPDSQIVGNPNTSATFLVINPASPSLADRALTKALSCAIQRQNLAGSIGAMLLTALVLESNQAWSLPGQSSVVCEEQTNLAPRQQASNLLRDAGYMWAREPSGDQPGRGLTAPGASRPLPSVVLLASEQASNTAKSVQDAAQYLGMPVNIQPASPADIRFALFNSHKYDMAIVGWRLSAYPGYLCDWFGDVNPFGYSIPQVRSDCAALSTTTDMDKARQLLFDIQSALAQDPPFIPLYSGITFDATRDIRYPFEHVLNGLSSVYGAPDLAIPAP